MPPVPAAPAPITAPTPAAPAATASEPVAFSDGGSSQRRRRPWHADIFPTDVRGVEHEPGRVHSVYWLAASLVALALFGMAPALREIADHLRNIDSPGVARWAYLALFLGAVQIVYAIYMAQLPDWSSVWVVAMISLLIATGYAMILALTLLSGADHEVVRMLQLAEHADRRPREPFSRATMWCFIMLSTTGLLTYFAGRVGVRWHHISASMP